MMNSIETQTIPTTSTPYPIPKVDSPQVPLDPTNPLVWVLVMTALLGNTDEVINAIANLLRAIASFKGDRGKRRNLKK